MDKLPFFSVIIPTYNRPGPLAACLASIARLHYPKELFEVIVVDDGSQVSPKNVVDSVKGAIAVQLFRQSNTGPAGARNRGARNAKGDFLAFTDDDCEAAPDWLEKLAARFAKAPDAVIGGQVTNALSGNSFATASQTLTDYLYLYFNVTPSAASFFTTNNLAVSRVGFLFVGGYDESFYLTAGEDREFCHRWTHLGRPMVYAPEAIVRHSHRMNFFGFWRQHFNYGWGAFKLHQTRANLKQDKIRLEPMSFYLRLLAYPFSQFKGLKAVWIGFLTGISQFAYALGFFLTTLRFKLSNGAAPALQRRRIQMKQSNPLGVAVIGCGKIVEWVHIRNLARMKNARVVALADSDAAAARRAQAFAPGATVHADWKEVLDLPGVDAVLICLPTAQHAAAAKEALLKGKHVYLEKPLAVGLEEAENLLQTAAAAGQVAQIGFNFRFSPLFLKLKRLVESGAAGEITAVRTFFSSAASRPAPAWKQKVATGGGALLDLASHHFDLIPFIFGSKLSEVSARIWSQKYEEDSASVQWRLDNGLKGESFFSLTALDEDRIVINSGKGKFAADRFRDTGFLQKISRSGYEPSYKEALKRFLACVTLNKPAAPSFSDGYESLLAVRAARLSHEKNAPVLVKELRRENFAHQ